MPKSCHGVLWPPHHRSALIVGAGGIAEAEPVDRGFPGAASHLASGFNMQIRWNSNDTTAKFGIFSSTGYFPLLQKNILALSICVCILLFRKYNNQTAKKTLYIPLGFRMHSLPREPTRLGLIPSESHKGSNLYKSVFDFKFRAFCKSEKNPTDHSANSVHSTMMLFKPKTTNKWSLPELPSSTRHEENRGNISTISKYGENREKNRYFFWDCELTRVMAFPRGSDWDEVNKKGAGHES